MSWTEDDEVLSKLDDLFDVMNEPMTDFMRTIWDHHENSAEWLMLSLVATFIRDYNVARFEGVLTGEGEIQILQSALALQFSTARMMSNPSLQIILGQGLAELTNRGVVPHE